MDKKITDKDWKEIEDLRKEEKASKEESFKSLQNFFNPFKIKEAEWITQIRDFCRETETFPPHILQFYKEHHTEKAPN